MMQIRDFHAGDAPALRGVFESAIHGTARRDYSRQQADAWAPRTHDTEAWAARMLSLAPFVALVDGRIAGYADLQANGCIDHFYVAAEAGGQGVGSALMRHILARAEVLSLAELTSNVSLTAQPFFARFGFEVEAQRVVTVGGVALCNAAMRRRPA